MSDISEIINKKDHPIHLGGWDAGYVAKPKVATPHFRLNLFARLAFMLPKHKYVAVLISDQTFGIPEKATEKKPAYDPSSMNLLVKTQANTNYDWMSPQ